ncbi:DUF3344 domain-containing protein [Streptomyces sp. NPDC056987]|uniref:DUF3344 domain-containing protein n=1 Tax=Streptomyces sp. NPDC056987 TaxID=3345988 RepID=UPI00363E2BD3
MRNSAVHAVGRGLLCGLATLALSAMAFPVAPVTGARTGAKAGAKPGARAGVREEPRIPFARRYQAVQHGGIVRAANSAVSCRAEGGAADSCEAARAGGNAVNQEFDMFYSDIDGDPNTYNSTRAELPLPDGARVSYARLYWGGNLRAGEQKPAADNGRVLFAEPGGVYREVLADTVIGHRTDEVADAYQASADVTPFVRDSGPGLYTVAQVNVAMGRSAVGTWGGWTLVVAYEKDDAPLRHLALWDGFEMLGTDHRSAEVDIGPLRTPVRASGRLGVVAYDGDRGLTGDALMVETGPGESVALHNEANPSDDVMNSGITDSGSGGGERQPSYENTLGYDSDVFDLSDALVSGSEGLGVRFGTERDSLWLGALFVEADVRN